MLETLKKRRDFLRAARSGVKSVTPGLILQVRADRQADPPAGGVRVGFTVSRKVGNAVARNRTRRRLRAAAEQVLQGGARQAGDYVLIGRRETVSRPFAALVQDLEDAVRRAGTPEGSRGTGRRRNGAGRDR